jgi:pyridinium-3,5-biscarboxylic acid mononucleotide sulfurtransferase
MSAAPGSPRLSGLRALLSTFPSALVGYSGGVDSALLAVVLRQELGRERMLAVIGRSPSYPQAQWQAARDAAAQFDVPLLEVDTRELDDPDYAANPTNRCFFCKRELWARLTAVARARGFAVVCDGTIADDLLEHRPGRAAGEQAEIRSPLVEVGMSKADVRAAARAVGLPLWNAPAAPCLSSRVAYGLAITPSRLHQVEAAEAYLRSLGVTGDLRVRHRGDRARIEAEPAWIAWLLERNGTITERLVALGFPAVEIDPRGYRRGSLILETTGEW